MVMIDAINTATNAKEQNGAEIVVQSDVVQNNPKV